MDYINIILRSYTIIWFISTLSFIAGSNINCNGKAFHCVNSTHFKICVDLGGGMSMTVDEFLIPCPRNTVCTQYNLFECEYELTTTLPPATIQSEVTNEQFYTSENSVWEQLDITTIFPTKQRKGMEFSEKYYNKVKSTPASFTLSFLSDAEIDPVTSSNNKNINTSINSNINKTSNISRSNGNELVFSTNEAGIDVIETLPNNVNKLVPDIGVGSNYNTTQNRKTIDSITSKSSKPLNQNSLDLDTWLTLTKQTNSVASETELSYSASAILLPVNFSNSFLQENITRILNITQLIRSDNMIRERNLDHLITTEINKSDNITKYRNTNTDKLNSTTLNIINDEKITGDVSYSNKKSKVNSVITPELSTQHLTETTTSNYPILLNTADAIETFLNEGINITTNLEKLSVSDGDFIKPISTTPETSVVRTNETWSKPIMITVALDLDNNNITTTTPINYITAEISNGVTSLRPLTDLISINGTWQKPIMITDATILDNNNIIATKPSNNITAEKYNEVTSLKTISDLILKNETQPELIVVISDIGLDNNNITITETSKNIIMEKNYESTTLKPLPDLISKNETWPESVVVKGETHLDNNNIKTRETSKNITMEKYNGNTSLKPIPDLISKNETWPESVVVIGEIGLDNNNITITGSSKNIKMEKYSGVTTLKPLPDLISKTETWPESVIVIGETYLDINNISTTQTTKNITIEKYNGITSLKKIPVLDSKNETWPESIVMLGEIHIDNNNMKTTETSKNVTTEKYNVNTTLKPIPDLISKNEFRSESDVVIGETYLDNNNIKTTERSKNITIEKYNGNTSLKPIPDLISKNETQPESIAVIGEIDLDNNNITITETSKNVTMEKYSGVTTLKPLPDLISKNETWPESVVVIGETYLDNNNIKTTETSKNITIEKYNGNTSLKPIPDLISKNETQPESIAVIGEIDLDNNNITITETSKNVTMEKYSGVTTLKPLPDLISKNETWPESVVVIGETYLDNNNIKTTETSKNITIEKYNGNTSLKPIPDLISKNETQPESIAVIGEIDLDNNNITITETSKNVTMEKYNGVTTFKPISDLISKNETQHESIVAIKEIGLDNNNITITETSKNITMEKYNGVTIFKPLPDLILKDETQPESIVVIKEIGLDNNNITITETSKNITMEKYNGVTSLNSLPDLMSKNKTQPESIVVISDIDLDNNNIKITETSKNITIEKYNGVTSLKKIPDLISKNETWPRSIVMIGEIHIDKNNMKTKETSNNITTEKFNVNTTLKLIPDLISENEFRPESVVVKGESYLDNNNISTTETNKNITMEKYNGVTSLKPLPDSISKNETQPESIVVIGEKGLENNNITITKKSKNLTMEKYNGVTSLKPLPDLILKNETQPESIVVIKEIGLDNNNITITETSKNITMEKYNGVTTLKPLPDLISKNDTRPESVVVIGETYLNNNNMKTTEKSNNITMKKYNGNRSLKPIKDLTSKNETWPNPIMVTVATDLDNSNLTTREPSNNITVEISNGFSSLKSSSDINLTTSKIQRTDFKLLIVTETFDDFHKDNTFMTTSATFTNHQSLNEETTTLSSFSKIPNYNFNSKHFTRDSVGLISFTDSVTSDFKQNTNSVIKSLPATSDNPITLMERNSEVLDNKSRGSFLNEMNYYLNSNLTLMNKIPDVYERKESDTASPRITVNSSTGSAALESTNSIDVTVTNNTFAAIDKPEYRVVSDNSRNIENTSKLENKITTKPLTYFVLNKNSKQVNLSETRTVMILSPESAKTQIKKKRVINKNINNKGEILGVSSFGISNLTKLSTKNILAPKLVLVALNITNTNNNITNQNNNMTDNHNKSFKDIQVKHNPVTNNLDEKSLTVNANYTDKLISLLSSNSKSIPTSIIKPHLIDIYNVSPRNFGANISNTHAFENKVSEINNLKRSEYFPPVKNITSSNNFSEEGLNYWRIVNRMTVAKPTKTFTHDGNVSEVKSLSVLTRKNYTNNLNATRESSITTNNLIRNTSSLTNSNKNNNTHVFPLNALNLLRIPAEHDKSSQNTGPSNILNKPQLELISDQDRVTISKPRYIKTNRSNVNEEQQLRNGHGISILTFDKGVTKNVGNKNSTTPINNIINNSNTKYGNMPSKQEFNCTNRGKYSDTNDCNKFYVCIGRVKPIIGVCPTGTVFSEFLKQCTKNVTHCIRNNQFKCTAAGRFINILCNNTYFICAKKKNSFIRFTLQCQSGNYLDKYNIKCTPKLKNVSLSDENSSNNTKELPFHKKMEGVSVNSNIFECDKEGKFKDPADCRKYYICKKGRNSIFRRQIKKCDSDEVFHGKKKKCVDVESYECDT